MYEKHQRDGVTFHLYLAVVLSKRICAGGLAITAGGLLLPFNRRCLRNKTSNQQRKVVGACTVNCGSRCPLRMHVVDGEIKYVETTTLAMMSTKNYTSSCLFTAVLCVVAFIIQTVYVTR